MTAISTNTPPAPAQPASAKPAAHDAGKAPADNSPFAVILAAANAASSSALPSGDGDSDGDTSSGAPQDDTSTQASASSGPAHSDRTNEAPASGDQQKQANNSGNDSRIPGGQNQQADRSGDVVPGSQASIGEPEQPDIADNNESTAPAKPSSKDGKSASGKDQPESTQPQTPPAQPNPNPVAIAHAQAAVIAALAPPPQQTTVPGDDSNNEDAVTVDAAGKSGTQPAVPAQPAIPAERASAARPATPAQSATQAGAAAQAGPAAPTQRATPAQRAVPAQRAMPAQSATQPASPAIAADPAQSAVAAAQAALKGDNRNPGNGAETGSQAGGNSDKSANAADNNAPAVQPQPQNQSQQPATNATPGTISVSVQTPQGAAPAHANSNAQNVPNAVHVASDVTPNLNSLAVEIAARSLSGAKQFQIRLDPPELGRVEVRLSIDASGKTEAHLTADRPDTLNLLQKDSSSLTQALRDSGLDVTRDGLNFSLRSQSDHSGARDGGQARMPRANLAASRAIDAGLSASNISFTGGGTGRLDIHV